MQTPEQFLKDYLALKINFLEKWAEDFSLVQRRFFKMGYNPFDPFATIMRAKKEAIINTNNKSGLIEIITTGFGESNKMRYTLVSQNESYLISLVELECSLCSSNKTPRQSCKICEGKSWTTLPFLSPSSK